MLSFILKHTFSCHLSQYEISKALIVFSMDAVVMGMGGMDQMYTK